MLKLVLRNLSYYRRTNAAVVLGVGVAVAVLAGALLVGESVRASLRGLFLQRLGRATHVVSAPNFFREALAEEVRAGAGFREAGFDAACPLIVAQGVVTHEASGRRAVAAQVYGVDARFWEFHGRAGSAARAPRSDEVLLSPSLAAELGAASGDAVVLRVEQPSDIPVESLHGRKDDVGSSARLTVRETLGAQELGEFSVRPSQTAVRAVFVPLSSLQRSLDRAGRVNTILFNARGEGADAGEASAQTEKLSGLLRASATLEDLGVKLRALDDTRGLTFESESGLIGEGMEAAAREAARRTGAGAEPVFSYLANSIRAGGREVPYSIVTAFGEEAFGRLLKASATDESVAVGTRAPSSAAGEKGLPEVVLNEWAARELGARVGDAVSLEYYVWEESGRLSTRTAEFRLAGVVPIEGEAADRDLVPEYPGITGSNSLADWDPPFPVELSRIRPQDEAYWDAHRTTPKAFITLARAQELWRSRFGGLTSLRVRAASVTGGASLGTFSAALRETLEPSAAGLNVYAVRAEGLAASRGATDFGEYFLYFSFFIVVSALLLTALFFRLGVEQRLREVGLLGALGYTRGRVRAIFLTEALVLAGLGGLVGVPGAYAYAWLLMKGLRTWWVGAVGTTALELHAGPWPFVFGVLGGIVAAVLCIVLTLRGLRRASARGLLAGVVGEGESGGRGDGEMGGRGEGERGWVKRILRRVPFIAPSPRRPVAPSRLLIPSVALVAGCAFLVAASFGAVGQAAGFFGGGALLLVALLGFQSAWLKGRGRGTIGGSGWWSVSRLGMRNATYRPGRSVLCITLIAAASFIIVAVDAFRRDDSAAAARDRHSGGGGYALLAESLLPVVHDPNTNEGRDALNLKGAGEGRAALDGVTLARLRLRPGDDASCLNLYRPSQPRILAPTDDFRREGRFSFGGTLDAEGEARANPWLLLDREFADGAVPFVADATSAAYVLHLGLGEDFLLERGGGLGPLRLRLVATLADSIFQGELIVSERNFLRHFPEQEGYRVFLVDVPEGRDAQGVAAVLEERLSEFGFDAASTAERLAEFHRVENTYLSTFQMLGGLGLALGTLGLAAVLLRNVLERRRELALLRAVGYDRRHFGLMIVAENALLLACGLLTGTLCALLAIAPVVASRGGRLPLASLGLLLAAVVVSGLAASLVATAAALRAPLLAALREE
ncbi:MAG: ABC transporter permease [Pyrinomonadaceae bacterium]